MTTYTRLPEEERTIFIGLDIHCRQWHITVRDHYQERFSGSRTTRDSPELDPDNAERQDHTDPAFPNIILGTRELTFFTLALIEIDQMFGIIDE